jgi:hypothetical protein
MDLNKLVSLICSRSIERNPRNVGVESLNFDSPANEGKNERLRNHTPLRCSRQRRAALCAHCTLELERSPLIIDILLSHQAQLPAGMFDPLHSTASVFGGTDDANTPPWPTTPHSVGSPVPNLRRASPAPPTPDKGPAPGLYGREPQIYGEPQAGLISPRETVGSNGAKYEKPEPYLRVRINGIDRNRRDILIKLDAQVCFVHCFGFWR